MANSNKVHRLEEWKLSHIAPADQVAEVIIRLVYPEITPELMRLKPKARKQMVREERRAGRAALKADEKFTLKLQEEKPWPGAVHGQAKVADLQQLAQYSFVQSISVVATNGTRKRLPRPKKKKEIKFFCVKMTVAVQIEGQVRGIQTIEERYVLFEAESETQAYEKAEATRAQYCKPYFNSDLELVRWHIESLDDACEVIQNLSSFDDFRQPEGVEVFSILKGRRLNEERAWLPEPEVL